MLAKIFTNIANKMRIPRKKNLNFEEKLETCIKLENSSLEILI